MTRVQTKKYLTLTKTDLLKMVRMMYSESMKGVTENNDINVIAKRGLDTELEVESISFQWWDNDKETK
jgi:hypothetical protein